MIFSVHLIFFFVRCVLFFFYFSFFFSDESLIYCGMISERRRLVFKGVLAVTTSVVGFLDYDLETKDYIRPSGWIKNAYTEKSFTLMNEKLSVKYSQLPVEDSSTYRYLEEKSNDNGFQKYLKRFTRMNQAWTIESNIRLRNLYFEQNPGAVVTAQTTVETKDKSV